MGKNWRVTSCMRRCIPNSTHTSRPSLSPRVLLVRGVVVESPDHPPRERRKIKQTSALEHHLQPHARSTVEHSCYWGGGGPIIFDMLCLKEKEQPHIPTVPPESQLCTPRTTEQWHISEFPFVACQMESYLCMLVNSLKEQEKKSFKKRGPKSKLRFLHCCQLWHFKNEMLVQLMWTCANMISTHLSSQAWIPNLHSLSLC